MKKTNANQIKDKDIEIKSIRESFSLHIIEMQKQHYE
jgi:hypothetical protein